MELIELEDSLIFIAKDANTARDILTAIELSIPIKGYRDLEVEAVLIIAKQAEPDYSDLYKWGAPSKNEKEGY